MRSVLPLYATPILATAMLALMAPTGAASAERTSDRLEYAIPQLELRTPEARQGVASDGENIFAIDNNAIGKYSLRTGARVAGFTGAAEDFPHINSCTVVGEELVCAASNYPHTPHRGRVEFFNASDLAHLRTVELPSNPGSLTVLNRHDGRWWAVFANYDAKGGVAGQDHTATQIALLDERFAVEKTWTLPKSILDRIAPKSISGAAWGSNGRLYVSGHDKPEIYVLEVPSAGTTLRHVATFATASFGQAIAIDPLDPGLVWSIDRATQSVIASRIPSPGGG